VRSGKIYYAVLNRLGSSYGKAENGDRCAHWQVVVRCRVTPARLDRLSAHRAVYTYAECGRSACGGACLKADNRIVAEINTVVVVAESESIWVPKVLYLRLLAPGHASCPLFGITVNTVSPGLVDTPMTRSDLTREQFQEIVAGMVIGRSVKPEEIPYAVAWLTSRENRRDDGQDISPNGGQAIVGI